MADAAKPSKPRALEDYGTTPVPESEGKSWFTVGIVFWGVAFCLPAFLITSFVASSVRLGTAIGAFVIGVLILTAITAATGLLGAHTRQSFGMSARYTFGKWGALIIQIAMFFAMWGWFGVQLGFFVAGLGDGGLVFAFSAVGAGGIPPWLLMVIGGALMTTTAVFGFKAIERLTVVAIPLLLIIVIATIVRSYQGVSFAEVAARTGEGAMPFGAAISIVVSSFAVGALAGPDLARYSKNKGHAAGGMIFGMGAGFFVVLVLAAIMIKGAGEMDFSKVMLRQPNAFWLILAVITILLAAWTTNDNNLYQGSLALNAVLTMIPKWVLTLIGGVVGTIFALIGINTAGGFTTFLGIIAVVIPPAGAVMAVDYLLFRGEGYRSEDYKKVPAIRVESVISWALGSAFGFLTNFNVFRFTGIIVLDSFIIAAVVHVIISLILRRKLKFRF
jgi:cytosine permease